MPNDPSADHRSGLYKVDLPFTLGVDGVGEVVELGAEVPPEHGLKVTINIQHQASACAHPPASEVPGHIVMYGSNAMHRQGYIWYTYTVSAVL